MNKLIVACLLVCICCVQLGAQDEVTNSYDSTYLDQTLEEVLVTGTRYSIPIEKSGKTIYKLTEQDLKRNAGKTVADVLFEVPGLHIDGNFGSPGTNYSYFSRGGSTKNALILIDGLPINDPSGITAFYDLRLLSISQLESIEILKGGLSTLYGTGASSAVINIRLKGNTKEEPFGNIDVNYGSFQTTNATISAGGTIGKFSYFASSAHTNSEGFSSALDTTQAQNFDKDGVQKQNSLLKAAYAFNDKFSLNALIGRDKFETDYDAGAFFDAENRQVGEMLRFGLRPVFNYGNGSVELKTVFAFNKNDFQSIFPIQYEGQNAQFDLNNKHRLREGLTGFWGVHAQRFAFKQAGALEFADTKFSSVAPYASLLYQITEDLNVHAGLRMNMHSEYGSKLVYNFNPSYSISISDGSKIKLHASAASTFITPTGFQLFSFFGNPDLGPEESLNLEFGAAFLNAAGFRWNAAYFTRQEDNLIGFVSEFDDDGNFIGGAYQNLVTSRNVNGLESDLSYDINDQLSFAGHYTFLFEPDLVSDFYRIPQNKAGLSLHLQATDEADVNLRFTQVGKRTVLDFSSFSEIELEAYSLIDLFAQYQLLDSKLKLYGSVNNILDKDFVGVYGFTTRGRNFTIGLNYEL